MLLFWLLQVADVTDGIPNLSLGMSSHKKVSVAFYVSKLQEGTTISVIALLKQVNCTVSIACLPATDIPKETFSPSISSHMLPIDRNMVMRSTTTGLAV